jgi:hypothetical protein
VLTGGPGEGRLCGLGILCAGLVDFSVVRLEMSKWCGNINLGLLMLCFGVRGFVYLL